VGNPEEEAKAIMGNCKWGGLERKVSVELARAKEGHQRKASPAEDLAIYLRLSIERGDSMGKGKGGLSSPKIAELEMFENLGREDGRYDGGEEGKSLKMQKKIKERGGNPSPFPPKKNNYIRSMKEDSPRKVRRLQRKITVTGKSQSFMERGGRSPSINT